MNKDQLFEEIQNLGDYDKMEIKNKRGKIEVTIKGSEQFELYSE